MPEYFIGLMSGTSVDAIDVVIADITEHDIEIIAEHTHAIPNNIRETIFSLCQPSDNEIDRMGKLDYQLGVLFAEAANHLIKKSKLESTSIRAIGSHGQTIRHRPDTKEPFTLQIGNPTLITQTCKITTVADFRRADMAAGGQGAPLVPAFHQTFFSHKTQQRVVLNIGGMSNISILSNDKNTSTSGFDTGPGNVLLNARINKHKQTAYDEKGDWAKAHEFDTALLEQFLRHPYFKKCPPKSTGRETFDLTWVNNILESTQRTINPGVVQSTLSELTARTITKAINEYAPETAKILVCGGGAHNHDLIKRIEASSQINIEPTDKFGISADYVEAAAFAWFAKQTLHMKTSNLPSVTGAKHPVILGAIYPYYNH